MLFVFLSQVESILFVIKKIDWQSLEKEVFIGSFLS